MFHRSSALLVAGVLVVLAAPVSATNYNIGTRDDTGAGFAVDGLCSIREAMLAINTQRGVIGDQFSDERGVAITAASTAERDRLTFTKQVRNVGRSTDFVIAGERMAVNRGDEVEYRITVSAEADQPDVTGATFAFEFPEQQFAGSWRSYISEYVVGSTRLNGAAVDDVGGAFPFGSANAIKSTGATSSDTVPDGVIRAGRSAQISFRVRVAEGPDEAVSEDLPEVRSPEDTEYFVEAECPAGTGSNTIFLKSVRVDSEEDAVVYALDDARGEIVVGGGQNRVGAAVNPSVTFETLREAAFDTAVRKPVRLVAPTGQRLFRVSANATLVLDNVSLEGNGALTAGENGGLIFSQGAVDLRQRVKLSGGRAEQGGAIYMDGIRNLTGQLVRFEDNQATAGHGGAIATSPDFRGSLSLSRFYFGSRYDADADVVIPGNSATADGGAIHFDGVTPAVFLQNGTFYDNTAADGAALRIETDARISRLNNVTIAGNTALAGVALSYRELPPGNPVQYDGIYNSAVLGNVGGDCGADDGVAAPGSDLTLDLADIWYVVSAGGAPDEPSCGPLDSFYRDPLSGDSFDHSLVTFALLTGRNPADPAGMAPYPCDAAPGPASCRPVEFEDGLAGFLPNNAPLYAGAPAAGYIEPTLVDSASPEDAVANVCDANDQRDQVREPRCDAGAVELQIAAGQRDEFRLVRGMASLLDVLANDLGDLQIDCGAVIDPCVGFYLPPRRADTAPLIWISGDASSSGNPEGRTAVVIAVDASGNVREGVYYNRDPLPGSDEQVREFPLGYPLVLHTPAANFHGVDQMRYFVNRNAINGSTYIGLDPSANANLVVEPATGLNSRENISTLSGAGLWSLVLVMVAGLFRMRRTAALLLLVLPLLGMQARAADIIVNTHLDSMDLSGGFLEDGLCSLREALLASIDREPLFIPDCTPGATGRDRIIINVDQPIQLMGPLEIDRSPVDIEGQGPGNTIIRGSDIEPHRLIVTSSPIALRGLTLENGQAVGNGGAILTTGNLVLEDVEIRDSSATGAGGAVYLNYNSEIRRRLIVRRSYIHGNSAATNGGAISMVGQNESHELLFEGVTFVGNTAMSGAGGALDVNLPRGGSLRVVNNTFSENDAAIGGAIDLQQMAPSTTAYIINSTFIDNAATAQAGIELGNDTGRVSMSNSIYVNSGGCGSVPPSGDPEKRYQFEDSHYNLFSSAVPPSCVGIIDVMNEVAADSDIRDVLNGGNLAPGEYAVGSYVPPHFLILAEAKDNLAFPAGDLIIDAGNPADLVSTDNIPRACRTIDLRRASRLSGGRCDRGAHELLVPTAVEDSGSNQSRSERMVVIDVLSNDIEGDGVPDVDGSIVANTLLRGTIDVDPSVPGVSDYNEVTVAAPDGSRRFSITRAFKGSWQFDNSGELLREGRYDIDVVVRNRSDAFVASALQTVIVRASGLPNADDEINSVFGPALQITSVNPDSDGVFVVSNGALVIAGTTTAEDGSVVEIFINGRSLGSADVEFDETIPCGGDVGSAGEIDRCVVVIQPLDPLTCDDVASGGLEVPFPYAFSVSNSESGEVITSEAVTSIARFANVQPRIKGEIRRSSPGRQEVFVLDIVDPDDGSPIDITRISLKTAPKFATGVIRTVEIKGIPELQTVVFGIEGGSNSPADGYGAIFPGADGPVAGTAGLGLIIREEAGVVTATYTPRDVEGQFNDRFVLGYKDVCGAERTAEFVVAYPNRENMTGATGFWWLAGFILLIARRRRVK